MSFWVNPDNKCIVVEKEDGKTFEEIVSFYIRKGFKVTSTKIVEDGANVKYIAIMIRDNR